MSEIKTNKISSLDSSNSDITIDPDGTGDVIVASGNVGIGTVTPATSLDVVRNGVQPLRVQSTSGTEVAINMVNTGGNVQLEAHSGNFTIDADNVGIGTATTGFNSAGLPLVVGSGSGDTGMTIYSGTGNNGSLHFADGTSGADSYRGIVTYDHSNNLMDFFTNASRAMRIDSSGNVLVGTTDSTQFSNSGTGNDDGVVIAANAYIDIGRQGNPGLYINRTSNDGELAVFLQDGTTVGTISCSNSGNYIYFGSSLGSVGLGYGGGFVFPTSGSTSGADNSKDFGSPSFRWDDIYATNGTIQTSDQNEKQQIASLTSAEMTAAKAISALFKTFKWNNAVAAKGDAARTHTGVMAQQVATALTDAGLNAGDYAFYMSNTWWEADEAYTDDDGNAQTRTVTYDTQADAPAGATQRTRLGIRYPELLAFVGAATEQRLADIETRLTALENA